MSDPFEFDFTPAPPDVEQRLDPARIEAGIAAHLDDTEREALIDGRLRWALEGFDSAGLGQVTVMTAAGEVVAGGEVHWSVVVSAGDDA